MKICGRFNWQPFFIGVGEEKSKGFDFDTLFIRCVFILGGSGSWKGGFGTPKWSHVWKKQNFWRSSCPLPPHQHFRPHKKWSISD